jgi:hypothetical protein
MTPTRVVNILDEPCDVSIMRPGKWGNPFEVGPDGTLEEVLLKYKVHVKRSPLMRDLHELVGKRLGCKCRGRHVPDGCHGDVLVELIHETDLLIVGEEQK